MRNADNLPPSCAVVTKSGNLNFLEPSGPVEACNGTAFTGQRGYCHLIFNHVVLEDNVNELSLLRVFEIRMLDVGVTVAVVGKEYVFTYSECLSQALVIVHAGRMRPVTFSSVASLSLSLSLSLYHVFPHFLTKGTI